MANKNDKLPLMPLFQKFISETEKGKRLQKNGKLVAKSTIENYKALQINLLRYQANIHQEIIINVNYKFTKRK